jgi:predicted transcriptional regulator
MKKKPEPMTRLLGVRVSKDVKEVLDREAEADSRSTVSLVRKILKEYITRKISK